MREYQSHRTRQSPGENWMLLSFWLYFCATIMWLFRDFLPERKLLAGVGCSLFREAGSGVLVVAQMERSIFSSERNGDGKNEFLRNFEKEAKNLLTKDNKCEILHPLKEMNEMIAQIRKIMEYTEKQ